MTSQEWMPILKAASENKHLSFAMRDACRSAHAEVPEILKMLQAVKDECRDLSLKMREVQAEMEIRR